MLRLITAFCLYFVLTMALSDVRVVVAEPGIIRVPADYPTIKQALDAATSGDTIIVSEGTYAEGEIWVTKSDLTLMAEGTVVVDGQGIARWVFYVVAADNVTIKGFTVRNCQPGYQNAGICLDHAHNCTIESNTASSNEEGIFLFASANNTIANNTVSSSDADGIILRYSHSNRLTGNTAMDNSYDGIYVGASDNNTLVRNTAVRNDRQGIGVLDSYYTVLVGNVAINNTGVGISLGGNGASTLSGNNMTGNRYNFYAGGDLQRNVVDTSNLVDGKRVYYLKNQHDLTIDPFTFPDLGYLAVINSTRVTVRNISTIGNSEGVLFAYVTDSTIESVNVTRNRFGIRILGSHRNEVKVNEVSLNTDWGIWLGSGSTYNNVTQNTATHNYMGVRLDTAAYNLISDNVATDCDNGIYLSTSDNNTLHRNLVANNTADFGGGVTIISSDNTTVTENTMVNNYWGGLFLVWSFGGVIYHNNFISNTGEALTSDSESTWDDGYQSGGNYWSDYNGTDLYRGVYQNETGCDGVGDTEYIPFFVSGEGGRDHYPLMKPYGGPHDLGILGSVPRKTIIGEGYYSTVSMNLTMINYGVQAETFNLTTHTGTVIQNQTLTLASRNSTGLTLTFDTTDLEIGIYPLGAYAEPVQGETYTADNNCTTTIIITIPGDVDGDFDVDLYDAVKLLIRYGTEEPDSFYDPNCDIDNDGEIFLYDAVILLTHYGQKYP